MFKSILVCALVAGFSLVSTATFSAKGLPLVLTDEATVTSRSTSVNGNKAQTVKTVQKARKVQTIRERRPSTQKDNTDSW